MLLNNGKVKIEKYNGGHKIISRMGKSTPGAYRIFNVKPYTTYHIKVNYGSYTGKVLLWVATIKNANIEFNGRICLNRKHSSIDHYFTNGKHNKIKVGLLFSQPNIGDYYEIKNITLTESNKSNKKKRLAVIVPYRDRYEHLKQFIPHMDKFLDKFDYSIFIIHQKNDDLFNRAALFNIGFDITKHKFDYFSFHDIDLLPESSDYSYPARPCHLSQRCSQFGYRKKKLFGGVILLTKEQFVKSNGFSNRFRGWGGEDDDMGTRAKRYYSIEYRPGKYKSLDHPHVGRGKNPNYDSNRKIYATTKKNPLLAEKDGLNTLNKKFKYKVLNRYVLNDDKKEVKTITYKNKVHYMIDVNF